MSMANQRRCSDSSKVRRYYVLGNDNVDDGNAMLWSQIQASCADKLAVVRGVALHINVSHAVSCSNVCIICIHVHMT